MDISKALTDLADLYKRTDDEIHEDLEKIDMLAKSPESGATLASAIAASLSISIERKKAWLNGVDAALKAVGVCQLRNSEGSVVCNIQ